MFIKIFIKNGKKLKFKKYFKFIIFNLIKKNQNLDIIFIKFYKILFFPFYFRTRYVAGRKLSIPIILNNNKKEIFYIIKYIKKSLIGRSENFFKNKLLNEILDILEKTDSSLTLKKIQQMYTDLNLNFINLRFIRV
jgi:ribosomal protein S7